MTQPSGVSRTQVGFVFANTLLYIPFHFLVWRSRWRRYLKGNISLWLLLILLKRWGSWYQVESEIGRNFRLSQKGRGTTFCGWSRWSNHFGCITWVGKWRLIYVDICRRIRRKSSNIKEWKGTKEPSYYASENKRERSTVELNQMAATSSLAQKVNRSRTMRKQSYLNGLDAEFKSFRVKGHCLEEKCPVLQGLYSKALRNNLILIPGTCHCYRSRFFSLPVFFSVSSFRRRSPSLRAYHSTQAHLL